MTLARELAGLSEFTGGVKRLPPTTPRTETAAWAVTAPSSAVATATETRDFRTADFPEAFETAYMNCSLNRFMNGGRSRQRGSGKSGGFGLATALGGGQHAQTGNQQRQRGRDGHRGRSQRPGTDAVDGVVIEGAETVMLPANTSFVPCASGLLEPLTK